jgi:phage tail-like protein
MPLLTGTPRGVKQRARFIVRVEAAPGRAMLAGFMDCTELKAEAAVSKGFFGGSMVATKAPARVEVAPITLKRGATQNADLWNWFVQTVAPTAANGGLGTGHLRALDIIEQDRDRSVLNRWRCFNVFPSVYSGATEYNNDSDEFLLEQVTLEMDYFKPIGLPGAYAIDHLAVALP